MKKISTVTLFLVVIILGQVVGVTAGTTPRLFVNIPFAFHVGGQQVPAGEYVFEMIALGHSATGSSLTIHSRDGSVYMYLNAIRGEARNSKPAYTATFSRYGGTYFLSQVRNGLIISGLPKTRAEKELALAYWQEERGKSSKSTVVASFNQE